MYAKIPAYGFIVVVHLYTVYHIHYRAGFLEETILAFTGGYMDSSHYTSYLNYIFDVFYITLLATYFVRRWHQKPSSPSEETHPSASDGSTGDLSQTKGSENNPKLSPKTRQNKKSNKNANKNANRNNSLSLTTRMEEGAATGNARLITPHSSPGQARRRRNTNSLSIESGPGSSRPTDASASTWFAGDVASMVDVVTISVFFPFLLLVIYLGWNLQTSIEYSWLSWRWLWGWWLERWNGWRIAAAAAALVGITMLVRPARGAGKKD